MLLAARSAALALVTLFAVGCAATPSEDEPSEATEPAESTGTTQQAYTGLTGTTGTTYGGTCLKGSDPECLGEAWDSAVVSGGMLGYCSVDLSKAYGTWGTCTFESMGCGTLTGCRTKIY